jgi:hypothetical protein
MRFARHVVEWHGECYAVEPLHSLPRVNTPSPIWAVFRHSEFIGTLPYTLNETTKELEVRCVGWLRDLLESPQPGAQQ